MKKILLSVVGISLIFSSCNSKGLSLPSGVTYVFANFINGAYSYELELDLENSEGKFTFKDPIVAFENHVEVAISLSDSNIEKIQNELNKVRFKETVCNEESLGVLKYVNFSNYINEAVRLRNVLSQELDQTSNNFSYTAHTNKACPILLEQGENYYFTSSYKSLYDLFIEIIEAQSGADGLPEGWQSKI